MQRSLSAFIFVGGGTARHLTLGTTSAKDVMIGTNNAENIRVLSGGNVGIGTSTPAGKLDIKGAGLSTGIGLQVTDNSGTPLINLKVLDSGFVSGRQFAITPEGGYAVLMVAGEALNAGEVVYVPQAGTGNDGEVRKAPTTNEMPIGVVYASASAAANVWIVTSGKCLVLPETGITAARGNVMFTSSTAGQEGRVEQASSGGNVALHWRECGHFINTGSGNGVATLAVLHFN